MYEPKRFLKRIPKIPKQYLTSLQKLSQGNLVKEVKRNKVMKVIQQNLNILKRKTKSQGQGQEDQRSNLKVTKVVKAMMKIQAVKVNWISLEEVKVVNKRILEREK